MWLEPVHHPGCSRRCRCDIEMHVNVPQLHATKKTIPLCTLASFGWKPSDANRKKKRVLRHCRKWGWSGWLVGPRWLTDPSWLIQDDEDNDFPSSLDKAFPDNQQNKHECEIHSAWESSRLYQIVPRLSFFFPAIISRMVMIFKIFLFFLKYTINSGEKDLKSTAKQSLRTELCKKLPLFPSQMGVAALNKATVSQSDCAGWTAGCCWKI